MLIAAAFSLGGCGAAKALLQPRIALKDVTFEVLEKANDATPFSVDLVAVSDEALLPALLAMSAAQWFNPAANNLKRDYPAPTLRSWYYELTPGQKMAAEDAQFGVRGIRAVFLFANYKGKGAYRLRLDATPHATVRFSDKTVELAATR